MPATPTPSAPTLSAQSPTAEFVPTVTLGRELLLSRIVELNPTATTAFLAGFSAEELQRYVDHLASTERGRMRTRPTGARAIEGRVSRL